MCLLYTSLYAGEDVVLPVDPSLSLTRVATLPSVTVNDLSTNGSQVEITKQSPSAVLSPPNTTKLIDKIQQWEFVDLSSLLVTLQSRVTMLLLLTV